jgi:hypothetical protein
MHRGRLRLDTVATVACSDEQSDRTEGKYWISLRTPKHARHSRAFQNTL